MNRMIRILNDEFTSVHENIAAEEAIFTSCCENNSEPVVRIWKNPISVVLGRSQKITEEVNESYCLDNNIPLIRRFTGGGTVYQDLGNINTTFCFPVNILHVQNDITKLFGLFRNVMTSSLLDMGYTEVSTEGWSNIFIKNKKISGAAGSLRKGWFIHHATLLIAANLENLENCLLARSSSPISKRMSRYFQTTNLNEVFSFKFEIKLWQELVSTKLEKLLNIETYDHQLSPQENQLITRFLDKYIDLKWLQTGKYKRE